MRLIDADEFERRIKRYDTTDYADKALYNFAHNEMITMPTVDVLDKIRAEIADLDDAEYEFEGYYKAVNDALQIIDKYYKAERSGKE